MIREIEYAARTHRIGLIVPSSNTNVEPDFQLLCPAGVTVHSVRSGGYDINAIPDSDEMQKFVRQSLDQNLADLADSRMDVIAYGCTSATLSEGPVFDAEFCRGLTEKTGKPTVTTAGALIEALKALNIKRVAFTSPYVKRLSAEAVRFLDQSGINVVNELAFEQELSSLEQNALTPQDAFEMACKVNCEDAEAIVISCTDYRSLEAVLDIEAELNKPVITSNQALAYACLKRLGLPTTEIARGGILFRDC
ncbi:MAG: maleate isomerase [Granulosicoccus sp.]|jgi:maleate isomerase